MQPPSALEVRRVHPDDVETYRDIRLRALQDAPSAFASTYAAEAAEPLAKWVDQVAQSATGTERATFLALDGGRCVGLVGCGRDDRDADRQLVSMWVAATHRGTGVATALVSAILSWAGQAGAARIGLWVTSDNVRARRFYERMGFTATGEVQPLPSDPRQEEVRMVRDV
jgi:RimJ/RimL family protein N-acetyltransferase